jgi:type VI secretion system Hcp family effector
MVDSVPVLSFSQRVDVASSIHAGTGAGPGVATVSPIQITRYSDTSSPNVSLAAAQGTVIPTATITLLPYNIGGPRPMYALSITLTDVIVSQVTSDATTQNNIPLEKLSLSFGTIKWEFTTRDAGGEPGPTMVTTYDVTQKAVDGNYGFYPTFVNFAPNVSHLHFENETPFSSLAVQLTNSATGHAGTGAGAGAISPLSLVVPVFVDTFGEFGSALKGTSVPLVTAHFLVSGAGTPFDRLVYQMTTAQVVSVAIDTTATGSLQETVGFDFTKIKWEAQTMNADGSMGPVTEAEWTPGSQTSH